MMMMASSQSYRGDWAGIYCVSLVGGLKKKVILTCHHRSNYQRTKTLRQIKFSANIRPDIERDDGNEGMYDAWSHYEGPSCI